LAMAPLSTVVDVEWWNDEDGEANDFAETCSSGDVYEGESSARLLSTGRRREPRRRFVAAIGATAAAVAVLTAAASSSLRGGRLGRAAATEAAPSGGDIVQLSAARKCHMAVEGEECYNSVMWARTSGISNHPEWYEGACSGLSSLSKFEEFQGCVYKLNSTACPPPCNPSGSEVLHHLLGETHQESKLHPAAETRVDPCHIAQVGDRCYTQVLMAMKMHPDKFATFNEYQAKLHDEGGSDDCPQPCGCSTAVEGEECYKNVRWVIEQGIRSHPTWYVGLTPESTPYDVQAFLQFYGRGMCALPCHDIDPKKVDRQMVIEAAKAQRAKSAREVEERHAEQTMERQMKKQAGEQTTDRQEEAQLEAERRRQKYKNELPPWKKRAADEAAEHEEADADLDSPSLEDQERQKRDLQKALEVQFRLVEQTGMALGAGNAVAEVEPEAEPEVASEEPEPETERERRPQDGDDEDDDETCHTAVKGEQCYKDVLFAMKHGIYEHPEWYPDMSPRASFEEFQTLLSRKAQIKCPKPCACHDARPGEACHENIKWVLSKGVRHHPELYESLTPHSRFEEVQAFLAKDEATQCKRPCAPKVWPSPSLFCFSVFRSEGYEVDLVLAQLEKNAGIFDCDEFAVLSDKKLPLIRGVETEMIPPCEKVGVSKDGTAANTLVFMQAWNVIFEDVRWQAHDWVIKADPDAVLLVDRLRSKLQPHTGQNIYVKNCDLYSGPAWPMMFGSLEAISVEAIETYRVGADRCKKELEWQAWGEDLFMGNCLTLLGTSATFDGSLIGDNVCKGANCGDGVTAVYHPFKSKEKWFACYDQALGKVGR